MLLSTFVRQQEPMAMEASESHVSYDVAAGADPKKVFQCGECHRAYSRVDHLARHVRSRR